MTSNLMRKAQIKAESSEKAKTKILLNALQAFKDIRLWQYESQFAKDFQYHNHDFIKNDQRKSFISLLPGVTNEVFIIIALVFSVVIVLLLNNDFQSVFAQLGVFLIAAFRAMPLLNRMMVSLSVVHGMSQTVENFLDDYEEMARQQIDPKESLATPILAFDDKITIKDLSYSYGLDQEKTLKNINLEIPKGSILGITGPSGGGKSTLANIILGFLPHYEGGFYLDDIKITADNIGRYRPLLSMVDQGFHIASSTIAENIAFGYQAKDIDQDRVQLALEKAQLWEWVQGLKDGIWHEIDEFNSKISGGQRQRIAIARAFFRQAEIAEIMVMDEASSSLDNETEHQIFQEIFHHNRPNQEKKTVIMISHRLSTLKECDQIIFLEGGVIKDSGDFQLLYHNNPRFKHYCDLSTLKDQHNELLQR